MLRSPNLTTDILRLRWLIAAEQFQLCFARSVPPTEELQLKCRQLEWSLAARRFQLAYARHVQALIKTGFNPDQPRVPAGNPDGGQWTSGGGIPARVRLADASPAASPGPVMSDASPDPIRPGAQYAAGPTQITIHPIARDIIRDPTGQQPWEKYVNSYRPDGSLAEQTITNRDGSAIRAQYAAPEDANWDERYTVTSADGAVTTFQNAGLTQTIFDGEGRPVSQTIWTSDGPEPQATVQPAYLESVPHPAARALGAALALYTWMSSRNSVDQSAVFAFRADAFTPGESTKDSAIWVGKLTRDQVDDACPRHAEVQSITNQAAGAINQGDYETPQKYGTAVHKWIEEAINSPTTVPRSPPPDPNFRAEVSLLKSEDENYGVIGTRRIDVYENPRTGTVCVYDIKTGRSGLKPPRMLELASTVQYHYPGTQRIIVTEVRPRR